MKSLLKQNVHKISPAKFQIGLQGHKLSELIAMANQAKNNKPSATPLAA